MVDFLCLGFRGCGFADTQDRAVVGGQGADLMGFDGVAHGRPGGMDALIEEVFSIAISK